MTVIRDNRHDLTLLVTRDGSDFTADAVWDGKVKNLVYDSGSLSWIAQVPSTGGAGGGDASAANQTIMITDLGSVTEAAPATDTASSGLNGRLQRIAQRLTSLIALFPSSLGQKNMAGGLPVTLANDQTAIPVTGTFFQGTQPVSIASMPSTPVTGTFWQGTQPVSIASMPSTPITGVNPTLAISGTAASVTDIIAATDVSAYSSLQFQTTGLSGTIQVQFCNESPQVNWIPVLCYNSGNSGTTSGAVLNITTDNIWTVPVQGKYMRIRMTAYTSGTVAVAGYLSTLPFSPFFHYVMSAQSGNYTARIQDSAGSSLIAVSGRLPVDGSGVTQPISAVSLPIPANAAKEAGGNLDNLTVVLEMILQEQKRNNFLLSTAFGLDPGSIMASDFSSQQTIQ